MTYEELLSEADNLGLITKGKTLISNKGRIKRNRIAIKKDLISADRACVLAEELGHYHTSYGDILDQSSTENRKPERRARIWAYNRVVGLSGIINSFDRGYMNQY